MENQKEKILIEGKLDHLGKLKTRGIVYSVIGTIFRCLSLGCGFAFDILLLAIVGTLVGCFIFVGGCLFLYYYSMLKTFKLVVTDKRVYGIGSNPSPSSSGIVMRKFEFSLPLSQISCVSKVMLPTFKWDMVSFGTSSGKIEFGPCANVSDICNIVNGLIGSVPEDNTTKNNNASNADELKKYNELFKEGAISKEEYDNKKKELLK